MGGITGSPSVPGLVDFDVVGRGGSARVYRAYQPDMDRHVAVKVIEGSSEGIRNRFDRERKAMGRLSLHPGIVTILDSGFTDRGEPFLTMPYLQRGSRQDLIDRQGPMPWKEALHILFQVAEAVDHGHRNGILHGDIKPGNILIDDRGAPLVSDFGVARMTAADAETTQHSDLTPAFSPPELFDAVTPTHAADVYSLAATFVSLVTGRAPFTTGDPSAGTPTGVMGNVVRDQPPDLRGVGIPSNIANGTQVNGQQVVEHDLESGDVITMGSTNLVFTSE